MSNHSLKSKAAEGFFWNTVEKFSYRIGQFIIGVVLARLLTPKVFGLIGMLSIFIALSQVFINSGMSQALIQKKDRTDLDYSTVFIFNLLISLLLYGVLFVTAPLIAKFYSIPVLIPLTRVLALTLIINSLTIVQRTKLEIELDFKTLAKIKIFALFIGGTSAITATFYGLEVWALVIQVVLTRFIITVGLWIINNWKFSLTFSKKSFDALFGFSWKLLLAGLYARGTREVYNLVIGKFYTASSLGYYTQARKLSEVSSGTIGSVLHKVSFPILAELQDEKDRFLSVYRRMIGMAAFISFPLMALLALLAKPLVVILLTEKWLPVVPLLQVLAIARIIYPIALINMNALNAVGRSDLFLKIDLAKFPIIFTTLVLTLSISVYAIVIGQLVSAIMIFFINGYVTEKLFGYGPIEQFKDIFPNILATVIMAVGVYIVTVLISSVYFKFLIGLSMGAVIYLSIAYLFNFKEIHDVRTFILKKLKD